MYLIVLIVFKQRSGTGTDSDATKGQIKIHDLLLHILNNERNCSLKSSLITRTFFYVREQLQLILHIEV